MISGLKEIKNYQKHRHQRISLNPIFRICENSSCLIDFFFTVFASCTVSAIIYYENAYYCLLVAMLWMVIFILSLQQKTAEKKHLIVWRTIRKAGFKCCICMLLKFKNRTRLDCGSGVFILLSHRHGCSSHRSSSFQCAQRSVTGIIKRLHVFQRLVSVDDKNNGF